MKEYKMSKAPEKIQKMDPVWGRLQAEAADLVLTEPLMGGLVHSSILHHQSFRKALSYRISSKLSSEEMPAQILREIIDEVMVADDNITLSARADIVAVFDRDPSCHQLLQPMLFFKGYQALQAHRVSNWLWNNSRKEMAYFFQMRCSEVFGVDIHPGAKIGAGIMIDHAHSIVIGETARVGNNVSMLHSVTLGGTGKVDGDRHPTIEDGVLIGAGAKILGNITIGRCSKIAAGSVVLKEIPAYKTVAGVPGVIIGEAGCDQPSQTMDQFFGDCNGDG